MKISILSAAGKERSMWRWALAAFAAIGSSEASAQTYKLDAASKRVVSMTFDANTDCPTKRTYIGRIVHRDFAQGATVVNALVIETADGMRHRVNIETSTRDRSMVDAQWIMAGLQQLTRIGRKATVRSALCGAAGRVEFAESLR